MNERANPQCENCADCKCNSDPDDDSSPVKDAEEPEVELSINPPPLAEDPERFYRSGEKAMKPR